MKEDIKWLLSCPCGDCNFKSHLKSASVTELNSTLSKLPENGNKTKIKAINAEIRRRLKNANL